MISVNGKRKQKLLFERQETYKDIQQVQEKHHSLWFWKIVYLHIISNCLRNKWNEMIHTLIIASHVSPQKGNQTSIDNSYTDRKASKSLIISKGGSSPPPPDVIN